MNEDIMWIQCAKIQRKPVFWHILCDLISLYFDKASKNKRQFVSQI